MNDEQVNPQWWPDDDAHEARHACWLIRFADNTEQRIGAWPPMTRREVMKAYRCVNARTEK